MAIGRNVIGARPNFSVTQRATAGLRQVGSYDIGSVPAPQAPFVPRTTIPDRLETAPSAGYNPANLSPYGAQQQMLAAQQELQEGYGLSDLEQHLLGLRQYQIDTGYATPHTPIGLPVDDPLSQAALQSGAASALTPFGSPGQGGGTYADPNRIGTWEANEQRRFQSIGQNAEMARIAERRGLFNTPDLNPEEISGLINSQFASWEGDRAMWLSARQQALADGQEAAAEGYDMRIREAERNIGELERQIEASSSIEQWFRQRVQGPYERAMEASRETDLRPIYQRANEADARFTQNAEQMESRLRGSLADLGFSEDQIDAVRAAATEDSAVAAAQAEVLEATKLRPGMLDAQKKLMFHMNDAKLQERLRLSAGNEFITEETGGRAIGDIGQQIGDLKEMRGKAVERARRAVETQFGSGPSMPTKDEVVMATMNDMLGQMAERYDLSQVETTYVMEQVMQLAAFGYTELNSQNVLEALQSGALFIGGFEEEAGRLIAEWEAANPDKELTYNVQNSILRNALDRVFDNEDATIFNQMLDTYNASAQSYERMLEKRVSGQLEGGLYDNRSSQNIADAKAGEGAYGQRARDVEYYAQQIQQWVPGRRIDGAGYFRPLDQGIEGQAANSDHQTAGALDVFYDFNDAADMAEYNRLLRPRLEEWERQGIIRYTIHPGGNEYHMDHVHISFALPGMGDANVQITGGGDRSIDQSQDNPYSVSYNDGGYMPTLTTSGGGLAYPEDSL